MKINMERGYDFDDLLLVPIASSIDSRKDVSLAVKFSHLNLDIPIAVSPMKGIVGKELIVEMSKLGGIGILHRFYDDDKDLFMSDLQYIYDNSKDGNFGMSVKLDSNFEMRFGFAMGAKILCIDVANGYLDLVKRYVDRVRNYRDKEAYKTLIMAGNVVTPEGVLGLYDAGADLVRVGIGSGQLCTTRNYTGVGYPQLSAIKNCSKRLPGKIVADGGIRNSGDAVKALACGANLLLIGSLFGRTNESAHNGIIYGMASRKLQEEYYHSVKSVEGMEKKVEKDTSLKDFLDEFTWGMKSAFTYLNARNISELRENANFIEVGTGSIKKGF